MTNLAKEETAAQVLAVIQAKFERPQLPEILDILKRAEQQATASLPQQIPDACGTHAGA
jgi:hypothetical protein